MTREEEQLDLSIPFNDIDGVRIHLLDVMVYASSSYIYKEIVVGHANNKLRLVYYPLLGEHKDRDALHTRTRALSNSKYSHRGIIIGKFTDLPPLEWINDVVHTGIKELLLKVRNERY